MCVWGTPLVSGMKGLKWLVWLLSATIGIGWFPQTPCPILARDVYDGGVIALIFHQLLFLDWHHHGTRNQAQLPPTHNVPRTSATTWLDSGQLMCAAQSTGPAFAASPTVAHKQSPRHRNHRHRNRGSRQTADCPVPETEIRNWRAGCGKGTREWMAAGGYS